MRKSERARERERERKVTSSRMVMEKKVKTRTRNVNPRVCAPLPKHPSLYPSTPHFAVLPPLHQTTPGHSIPSDLLPTQSYHRSRSSLSRPPLTPEAVFVVTFLLLLFFRPQSHPAGCEPHHTTAVAPPKTHLVESASSRTETSYLEANPCPSSIRRTVG